MVATCASERRGLLVNDYPDSRYALSEVVRLGVRHAMAQPLVSRDRLRVGDRVEVRDGRVVPVARLVGLGLT